MADPSPRPVKEVRFESIRAFFAALAEREHIHVVRVADQGLVEPAQRGPGLVMQPMVRVVATAFDHKANEILRWEDKWDVGSNTVMTGAANGPGRRNDPTGVRTRDAIIAECRKRGLQVVRDEEWTPEEVAVDTLAGIDGDHGA